MSLAAVSSRSDASLTTSCPAALSPLGFENDLQPKQAPTVLCVDDDPDISYAIELRLRPYDVEWIWAYFGTQGIWSCINERPDVVLLDYNLPQGRGDEVLHALSTITTRGTSPSSF